MKIFSAANLSLAAVFVGAPLFYVGFISQLGDPYPRPSEAQLALARFYSALYFNAGVALLIASLWLSGYTFSSAPRRSLLALALSVVAFFGFWFV